MFLNNDTIVFPGWLDSLIDTLEKQPEAGLVGSKILFANGRLQEAGGIVWRDASAMNFGREDDPLRPEYNYLREADYCSGCRLPYARISGHNLADLTTDLLQPITRTSIFLFGSEKRV